MREKALIVFFISLTIYNRYTGESTTVWVISFYLLFWSVSILLDFDYEVD